MSVNCVIRVSDQTKQIRLSDPLYYNNRYAHTVRVTCLNDDDTPADLTGVTCEATFVRPDGYTVYWQGTVTDNIAEVTLPTSCYLVMGRFVLTVQLVQVVEDETVIRTAVCIKGSVERNQTDPIVDPGHIIPSINELLEQIDDCEDATTAANNAATYAHDTADTAARDAERVAGEAAEQAERTAGEAAERAVQTANEAAEYAMGTATGRVRYDQVQSLTAEQKATARANVDAATVTVSGTTLTIA